MSWFSSAPQSIPIDDKIIELSSELIPNGEIDLIKALEISDLIRSKQTAPKDAMRSLKKRFMSTKNPNTQKSCLKLIDFCIKNGGEHFVIEISSKEFLDPLVVILHSNTLNDEVKNSILELIQNWSLLFSKNTKLNYITTIYEKLSLENFKFPSIYGAEFNDSFLESKVALEWVDSDACMICSDLFTVLNRKHHCRACGGVFCGKHSSNNLPLPEFGITIPVRVCDNCYELRKNDSHHNRHHKHHKSRSRTKKMAAPAEDEDDDLKKAIELSLRESGMPSTPSASTATNNGGPTNIPQPIEGHETDDEDEDMKKAIEASLRDLKVNDKPQEQEEENPYSNMLPQQSSSSQYKEPSINNTTVAPPPPQQQQQQNQITMTDEDNINLFSNLLERYKKNEDLNIYQDDQIQALHNNLTSLRPTLNHGITDSTTKYDLFADMHSKIGTVMRLYDGILQAHMTSLYENKQQQQQQSSYYQQPPQQQDSYYPPSSPQQQQQPYGYPVQPESKISLPSYPPSTNNLEPQSPKTMTSPLSQEYGYPPIAQQLQQDSHLPSYPPSTTNFEEKPASPQQQHQIPSYPPSHANEVTSVAPSSEASPLQNYNSYPAPERKFDFPGLPNYPAFETPKQETPKQEEKRDEAPLIEL